MRIDSKLCHLTENKAVVQVKGWINEKNIGSALAEGETVEEAEDKAISRLEVRIDKITKGQSTRNPNYEDKITNKQKVELQKEEHINITNDPSDWSDELAAID